MRCLPGTWLVPEYELRSAVRRLTGLVVEGPQGLLPKCVGGGGGWNNEKPKHNYGQMGGNTRCPGNQQNRATMAPPVSCSSSGTNPALITQASEATSNIDSGRQSLTLE